MRIPLQITLRHMPPSPALEGRIRAAAEKLEKFSDDIMRCHIVLEAPHKHRHKGNLYQVKIIVTVPDEEFVINRNPDIAHAHEDPYVAVRDAFHAMRRQLEDHMRRRRGKVKHHETPPHGRVSEIYPEMDYGRIESADGRDIYFHRNSVIDTSFDDLDIGSEVRFSEEAGEKGPQATTVHVIGKHHVA